LAYNGTKLKNGIELKEYNIIREKRLLATFLIDISTRKKLKDCHPNINHF